MEKDFFILSIALLITVSIFLNPQGPADGDVLRSGEKNQYVEIVSDGERVVYLMDSPFVKDMLGSGVEVVNGDTIILRDGEVVARGRMGGGHLIVLGLPVNINEASTSDLEALPGIGKKTAESIIKRREKAHFKSLQDITSVSGIGDKKLEKMTPYISL